MPGGDPYFNRSGLFYAGEGAEYETIPVPTVFSANTEGGGIEGPSVGLAE